jgi:cytochrome b561
VALHYSFSQKLLHWLMALLIILDLIVAQKFGGIMEVADRLESRADHAGLNLVVMALFLLRVFLRRKHGAPPLPHNTVDWQARLSKITHLAIYFFMAALFVTGLTTAINATSPIEVYGLLDITRGNSDENLFQFVRQFHEFSTQVVIALIGLHVVAVLYHQLVKRDNIMARMLRSPRNDF